MGFSSLTTPVVLLVFKRPEHTQQVFDAVVRTRPKTLFVVADGPRTPEEAQLCQAVREIVARVDWDCDVHHNFAENNLGLKARISSGLNWVFEQTDTAIILEDDCVPHPTFFRYCEELLDRYQDNERVMHISGDNFGYQRAPGITDSYYFSRYAHVWGWATWRRAWNKFDLDMTFWHNHEKRHQVLQHFPNWRLRRYWTHIFQQTVDGEISTWDYSWIATCLLHNSLCAMPYENLVTNIGAGEQGTNTKDTRTSFAGRPLRPIHFPLRHPEEMRHTLQADQTTSELLLRENTLWGRGMRRLQHLATRSFRSHHDLA